MLIAKSIVSHFRVLLFASSALLCSCSTGSNLNQPKTLEQLDKQFPKISFSKLPEIQQPEAPIKLDYKPEIKISPVADLRKDQVVINHNGREIHSEGNIGLSVRYALFKAYQKRGFLVKDSSPVELKLGISRWRATSTESGIKGEAIVETEVIDPSGNTAFSGVFEGSTDLVTTQPTDREVEEVLRKAMGEALSEMIKNERLFEIVTAF